MAREDIYIGQTVKLIQTQELMRVVAVRATCILVADVDGFRLAVEADEIAE